jgi:hypothetical protein
MPVYPTGEPTSLPSAMPSPEEPDIVTFEVTTSIEGDVTKDTFSTDEYQLPFRLAVASITGVRLRDVTITEVSNLRDDDRRRLSNSASASSSPSDSDDEGEIERRLAIIGVDVRFEITAMLQFVLDDDSADVEDLIESVEDDIVTASGNGALVTEMQAQATSNGFTSAASTIANFEVNTPVPQVTAVNTDAPTVSPTSSPTRGNGNSDSNDEVLLEVVIPVCIVGFFGLCGAAYYYFVKLPMMDHKGDEEEMGGAFTRI